MHIIKLYPEIITTKLSKKFIMHINGKKLTIVCILTFVNMIKLTSEIKTKNSIHFQQFSFEVLLRVKAQFN